MKGADREGPKLVKRMTLHLNGGAEFSEMHYEILADGRETGITMHERTNGRPEYRYTARELHHGDETLDMMDPESPDPMEWIRARVIHLSTPDSAVENREEAP